MTRRLVVAVGAVALAACSSKSSAPPPPAPDPAPSPAPPTPAPAPAKPPAAHPLLDLPNAGVSKLDFHTTVAPSNQMVASWSSLRRDAVIACREDAYNLAAFDTGDPEGLPAGSHEQGWQPAPFGAVPTLCEIRFYGEHDKELARACYRNGRVTEGDCPLPHVDAPADRSALILSRVQLTADGKSVTLHALYTLVPELSERGIHQTITCDGVHGKAIDDTTHLGRLDAGDTIDATVTFEMAKPVKAPKKCQLDIADKLTLATFCITGNIPTTGPCK